MNTSPLTMLRGLGKPVLAGLLVVLLFVSALASADPSLHQRLHADHQAPTHHCLVTLLDYGQTEAANTGLAMMPVPEDLAGTTFSTEFRLLSRDTPLFPERGPPCLI